MSVLRAAPFLGYVALGLIVVWQSRRRPGSARPAITLFLLYTVVASLGPGLLQHEAWPFSTWPLVSTHHGPTARHARLAVVDETGREHRVDARAWQPFVSDELTSFVNGRMLRLPEADRDRVAESLLQIIEREIAKIRAGGHAGYFDRFWGPLTAPYFLLHPHWWTGPADVPASPLVAFRLYRDSWTLDERRRHPDAVNRSIVFEYRRR
jgi:hypothetical protein